jgi:hypothetical protein
LFVEALAEVDPGIPNTLVSWLDTDTLRENLEAPHEDATFKPIDAAEMADF